MNDIIQVVITKGADGYYTYIGMSADATVYSLKVAPSDAVPYIKPCLEQLRHYESKDRTQWQAPTTEAPEKYPVELPPAPKAPHGMIAVLRNGKWFLRNKPKSRKKANAKKMPSTTRRK